MDRMGPLILGPPGSGTAMNDAMRPIAKIYSTSILLFMSMFDVEVHNIVYVSICDIVHVYTSPVPMSIPLYISGIPTCSCSCSCSTNLNMDINISKNININMNTININMNICT